MDSTMSPTNSSRTGCDFARRVEVEHAAAHAELAVLVDGILGRKPCRREPFSKLLRGDLVTGRDGQTRRHEGAAATERRGSRASRRRDNEAGGAGGQRVKRAGARRRHREVRRKTAVRIDFLRWKRQNSAVNGRSRRAPAAARRRTVRRPSSARHGCPSER